jgi:ferredoxin-NADP reductase
MPALLTSSGRPGFYFRVLQEGEVGAGDAVVKVGEAKERMSVTEISALLYLPGHAREQLERAMRIEALSPGWRSSFDALLQSHAAGNAGLVPEAAAHPGASGFRPLKAVAIDRESADVFSVTMQSAEARSLPEAMPGQYVVIRLQPLAAGSPLFRSYSLSGPVSNERYRISVKPEVGGAAGAYLQGHLRVGDPLEVSSPRGSFILQPGDRPVVLLSAGIGATPVLAMLHTLSAEHSTRPILWVQAVRDGGHHPFAAEVSGLMPALTHGRRYVCYSQPRPEDVIGKDFDAAGHLSRSTFDALGLSPKAEVYLCGPTRFMTDMKASLAALGVAPDRTHTEVFNGGESLTPGVVGAATRAPHPPAQDTPGGPLVSFARSGIAAHWKESAYQSILELAEACDVPVRWSCRAGVCHTCESGLISGAVLYRPEPLERPAQGNVLPCCSRPTGDVVLDL